MYPSGQQSSTPGPISVNLSPPAASVVTPSTPVGIQGSQLSLQTLGSASASSHDCALASSPTSAQQAAGWHQDLPVLAVLAADPGPRTGGQAWWLAGVAVLQGPLCTSKSLLTGA